MLQAVITTIQPPTDCVLGLAESLAGTEAGLVIAGDTKGPQAFDLASVKDFSAKQLSFLSIDEQQRSGFKLAPLLPTKHYCRKNLGYLRAMQLGASCIYETDDDNAPLAHWSPRKLEIESLRFVVADSASEPTWVNVYKHFTDGLIWPRGIPLDRIVDRWEICQTGEVPRASGQLEGGRHWAPIQQGLANGAPDVDAVWRLVLDREFDFASGASVM